MIANDLLSQSLVPQRIPRGNLVLLITSHLSLPTYFTFSTTTAVPYASTSVTPFMISVAS